MTFLLFEPRLERPTYEESLLDRLVSRTTGMTKHAHTHTPHT